MKCPHCDSDNLEDSRFCRSCGETIITPKDIDSSLTRTIRTPASGFDKGSVYSGRYHILEKLGEGGMGVVYKAQDMRLKRTVALKFLPPELTKEAEAKERFVREAQAAAALAHPHICTIHEIDEEEGKSFIVMEYVEGQSLKERIKVGSVEIEEVLEIAIQAAEGLEEAHKKAIVHRDIKSGNIMVDEKGQTKIMDFGLAKVVGESLITKEAKTMGTAAYMSPEQARGEPVDHRTDIWSLGVVLYELLCGQLPFRGEQEASMLYSIVHEEPKPLRKLSPDIPVEIEKVVDRALKKNIDSRYQSASEMLKDLVGYRDRLRAEEAGAFNLRSFLSIVRKPQIAAPAVVAILAFSLIAFWFFSRQAKIRWAENVALPQVESLIEEGWKNHFPALDLGVKAEKYIPKNPKLIELMAKISGKVSIKTTPPGANIYIKEYRSPEMEWEFIGVSPVLDQRMAYEFYKIKIEKEGYEPLQYVIRTWDTDSETDKDIPNNIDRTLDKKGTVPPGMVKIQGLDLDFGKLPEFFIDQYEVTNKEFKKFVDNGGYQKQQYWNYKFVKDGGELTWEEAMTTFVDQTKRPAPATWEAGDYKKGQEDYPVTGISWYEAAAYAEFAGKSLPTIHHWENALGINAYYDTWIEGYLILLSNIKGEGLEPVGRNPAISFYGAYDMAGNAREWCWNESPDGRCIRGGAWNDEIYLSVSVTQAPTFDRSERNGFRCVSYIDKDKIPELAFGSHEIRRHRDIYKEKPVSDDIFEVYKEQFAYDPQELNATIENNKESAGWIREEITFDAAYGNERVKAFLYLPKNGNPPYQTVIVFPGTGATWTDNNENVLSTWTDWFSFVLKNKRAVLFPIYQGTGERIKGNVAFKFQNTHRYTEYIIQIIKDFKRSIDYLETREDIDSNNLAFYGLSWGGEMANIIPAVEDRLKASISVVGGLDWWGDVRTRPEVDEINYVTRVKTPTLMLNGQYDVISFPYELSVKPMYELLGTPEKDKKLCLYETDHFVPMKEVIKETLAWLDKYLGPVN